MPTVKAHLFSHPFGHVAHYVKTLQLEIIFACLLYQVCIRITKMYFDRSLL